MAPRRTRRKGGSPPSPRSLAAHRALLRKGADDLANAEKSLSMETGRRRIAQAALAAREGEHDVLLKRSGSMEEELRQLSRSLLKAHESERMRISRELHDTLGQMLSGINVGLSSLGSEGPADLKTFRGNVARTRRLVQKSMRKVHEFARSLRPALLDDLGLNPALQAFAREFGTRNKVDVGVSASGEFQELDDDGRTALFRVAQEALVNVGRHAGAAKVSVSLARTPAGVRMEVWNDGTPFDVKKALRSRTNRHLGLLCMRERMEMVGGTLSILSSKAAGTTVRADIPLPKRAE